MKTQVADCPQCEVAADLVRENRSVPLGQRTLEIEDEFFRCATCGEEFYSPELADQRHQRAVERARLDDNLLSPKQIADIRKRLGMSQSLFERLLGVGEKTCVRWEMGRVCQNAATDRLIRLIAANPTNILQLASVNGVTLPSAFDAYARVAERQSSSAWGGYNRARTEHTIAVLIGGNRETPRVDFTQHETPGTGARSFRYLSRVGYVARSIAASPLCGSVQ